MITVTNLSKAFGTQTLFDQVSLQLDPGKRYGLIGANGSGKTTFLSLLTTAEEPSTGTVSLPKRCKLGVLRQDHFGFDEQPILEVVMRGHHELWRALVEKEELLQRADEYFDGERYAQLEDVITACDGYSFEARCGEILEGLGIPTPQHHDTLGTLSGGFKLRVLLGQVLASDPDVLLLDEPNNHLDILSIRWLEKFLQGYDGCAVIISHDHRFLDNVCTHMLDIDYETITTYTGNYTQFVVAKRTERERREAEITKQEKRIAHHQAFVDRFRAKASKARQAQSKAKLIEKTVIERLAPSSRRYPTFSLTQCRPSGKQVLKISKLSKAFGDNLVLDRVSFRVRRGDRLAIIGPNGIGKSTLLKIITGALPADGGELEWGHETHPGYFAQDHADILGDSTVSVESWLWEFCPGEGVGFVRSQLGRLLFSGDDVQKRVRNLSGGEAARLVFARLIVDKPNVLVLDEPTNHLDLESIEALVEGLKSYDGTLIFVSHDRWFVSQLATRILEITPAGLNDYVGTYEEYVHDSGDDHLDTENVQLRVSRDKQKKPQQQELAGTAGRTTPNAHQRKQLQLRQEVVTQAISCAEARVEEIDRIFCDPEFYELTPQDRVRTLQQEQDKLRHEVTALMAEWEQLEEQLSPS